MKQKKDILFLCQFFYPEYVSSATLPYDTAEALKKAGYSVGAICGYPREYNSIGEVPFEEIYEGIEIKRIKYLQFERSNFIGRLINYLSFTFAVALRFGYLKNYKSIIVYSNPPILPLIAALASKLFGTKIVFVSYDVYPEIAYVTNIISEGSVIGKIMKFVNNMVFRQINKVVALSNEMKDYLLKHRLQLLDQQVQVIPNWYENKECEDIKVSYQNELFENIKPKENFIVSYFGNMGICQELDTILNAIRELKNDDHVKFIFAGHGKKLEFLRNVIKEEELKNVIVYDFLHGQNFQDALNISDCFLVSLRAGLTGLAVPSKTYSYMMASKPVIAIVGKASDIALDLIENEAGYAMEVGEVSKLVNAIKELKNNNAKRNQMGKNCRKVFLEKYTKERCTQQYVNMMKDILGSKEVNKEKIKILVLSPLPPPVGGIASWTKRYLEWSKKNELNVEVINTAVTGKRVNQINSNRNFLQEIIRTINILKELTKKLKQFNPEVVHLNSPCGKFGIIRDYLCASIIKKSKIPLVVHFKCNIEDQIGGQKMQVCFFRKLAKVADLNLALNTPSKEYLIHEVQRAGQIVANFIDEDYVLSKPKLIKPSIKNILFVGHVIRTKGVLEIIEVSKTFPDIEFTLAGPVSDEIRNMKIPKNVIILGSVDKNEVRTLLSKADVFLFPTYTEGFANALLEAMAMGLPIITTNVGANVDMIEAKGGIIIRTNSVDDIIEAIYILKYPNLRKCISCWNIKKVKDNYLTDNVMSNFISIYKKLL